MTVPSPSNSFTSRKSLTLETLFAPVRATLLHPLFIGSLTYLLFMKPELFGTISPLATKKATILSFGCLFGIGLVYRLSSWLSQWSLNNFVRDKTWDWSKEIVLITGGSSGIGAEIVSRFAHLKIKTIVLDVVAPDSSALESGMVYYHHVDLTSTSAIKTAIRQIKDDHGSPSVLINNAGIGIAKNILDEDDDGRRRIFDVNVLAHFKLVQELLPAMIEKNHGHIVTVASMASFYTQAQNVSYACTKSAAMAFHEGLGQELRTRYGAKKVRTTIVHPTFVRTPLIERVVKEGKFGDYLLEPGTVADAVFEQVLSGYGGRLILPPWMATVALLRALPQWVLRGFQAADADVLASVAQ